MVQHIGASYHFSQAQKYVVPAQDMLTGSFKDVFGLEFSNYNLLALIANHDLRNWLQAAEQIRVEGGNTFTIAACNYAHSLVIDEVQRVTRRAQHRWTSRIRMRGLDIRDVVQVQEAIQAINQRITTEINALEQEIVVIGVGLSIIEVRRFRIFSELVGVSIFEDGQMELTKWVGSAEERKNAAEFMMDYLSRLIRLIEQIYVGVLDDLKIKVPLMEQEVIKQAGGRRRLIRGASKKGLAQPLVYAIGADCWSPRLSASNQILKQVPPTRRVATQVHY